MHTFEESTACEFISESVKFVDVINDNLEFVLYSIYLILFYGIPILYNHK
jgi:hypothetical protein